MGVISREILCGKARTMHSRGIADYLQRKRQPLLLVFNSDYYLKFIYFNTVDFLMKECILCNRTN